MELEQSLGAVRKQGLGVAAISYDSVGILKSFANRQHITYPLLSDRKSKIIKSFDILNTSVKPGTGTYGIPNPGIYIVDTQGKVISKYFEDDYKDRVSAASILVKQFGVVPSAARAVTPAKHLQITTAASNETARPGLVITLSLDIDMKPEMHVYAPEVHGYIPINWRLEEGGPVAKQRPVEYPSAEMLHLDVIRETVPVYRGHVRLEREIIFAQDAVLKPLVTPNGDVVVRGSFRYQACDDRECYLPQDVPVEWHFKYQGLDRERAPESVQHKLN